MESFKDVFYREWQVGSSSVTPRLVFLRDIDSTSSDLKRRLENGSPMETIVAAEYQSAGRGRSGNRWHSFRGDNLYLSLAIDVGFCRGGADSLTLLPLAAGVAAIEALRHCVSAEVVLKWPNDVLLEGRKVAGILCELPRPDLWPGRVIVGLGLNISVLEFPAEIADRAISLEQAIHGQGSTVPHPARLAARFVARLWQLAGRDGIVGPEIVDLWKARAEPFGRQVRTRNLVGRTVDLTDEGRLIVALDDGGQISLAGGIVENMENEA